MGQKRHRWNVTGDSLWRKEKTKEGKNSEMKKKSGASRSRKSSVSPFWKVTAKVFKLLFDINALFSALRPQFGASFWFCL